MLLTQIKMQLDYNLMKHDKFKPILEPASVRSVVDETIEMLRIQAKHSQVDIHIQVQKLSYDYLLIDKTRLQQIIINLLSNAIKFSHS